MNSSIYSRTMQGASKILFFLSFAVLLTGVITSVVYGRVSGGVGPIPAGVFMILLILEGFYKAIAAAVWPFVGAAFFWRMDKWLERNQ